MIKKTVGIIGVGKLGTVLAQRALKAGYKVLVTGSGDPSVVALTIGALAPGAVAVASKELAQRSDVIILALPFGNFRQLSRSDLSGKLVVDATNYWWEVDGPRDDILPSNQSSSEAIQEFLSDSRVVKALSHMGYHHLHDEAASAGAPNRKAIAVAGDKKADVDYVSQLVDDLGFEPLRIGPLSSGRKLEPGSPAFGANETIEGLQQFV